MLELNGHDQHLAQKDANASLAPRSGGFRIRREVGRHVAEDAEQNNSNPEESPIGEEGPPKQKRYPISALKSGIHRQKVRQHKFKAPQKSHEQLLKEQAKIRAGPDFVKLNEDEGKIEVEGGDGSRPIIRDFSCLLDVLQRNLAAKGYEGPTLVQKCVIPIVSMKRDYDMAARAPTGSGKTGAFLLPIIHLLEKRNQKKGLESPTFSPFVIVISPTRELAQQLFDTAKTFTEGTSLKVVCSYGEMSVVESVRELGEGCDIFVATIGRLNHFVKEGKIKLANLLFLVLDEVDKLVKDEVAFRDIQNIHEEARKNGNQHRTLIFSATFDGFVHEKAKQILRPNHFFVSVATQEALPPTVKQKFFVSFHRQKFGVLREEILEKFTVGKCKDANGLTWKRLSQKILIFCNSRQRTNWLALKLSLERWKAIPTSGDRTQKQRSEALNEFEDENGCCDVLVSTNITSRGLNLPGVELVINFEMPKIFEEFVHRTGRTGRAGNSGRAYTFIDPDITRDHFIARHLTMEMKKNNMKIPLILAKYLQTE